MSFREIIESGLLYADKTGCISSLLKSHTKSCFLSRPRRFGKTGKLSCLTLLRNYSWAAKIFSGA
ncbi:MAG: AAA family ATPase [Deltaproteobacteria bacterium]|nr:AAA family ATPase [Deltaproteobacteria bacterium]